MSENNKNTPDRELSEILQVRRDKLSAMKENGNDPFIKTKYDVLYKESNIEKNSKVMFAVAIILVISLIFNVLNYIELIKWCKSKKTY